MSDSKDLTAAEILALERGERTVKESLTVDLKPCPFCGGAVSKCDESPLYGGSIMHDETECLFKNNLLFHGNIAERWNSRPIEEALRSRIAELEAELAKWKAGNQLLYDTAMKQNHEFGLTMKYASELIEKKQRIAELEKAAIVWHKYPNEKPEHPAINGYNRYDYVPVEGIKQPKSTPLAVQVGDWVEIKDIDNTPLQAVVTEAYKYNFICKSNNGNVFSLPAEKSIYRRLSPAKVVVTIGCLSGTVRPVSINGIHIWFQLIGVDDKIIATIRISCLDTPTAALVRELIEKQEEEK